MPVTLNNQTALITGAGKGIGRAVAKHLAAEGVHLGLIARTASDLETLAKELKDAHGVKVAVATADVADRGQVESAVQSIESALGHIDILINNAGTGKFATVLDMPVEDWEHIIQVNLLGTYYVTRAVLPGMVKQNSGNIINVSSTSGERGAATTSAYSASKFGVMGLTESLMYEVRKNNIRVVALAPSTVATDLARNTGLKLGDEAHQMQPEDLAEFIVSILKLPHRVVIKHASIFMTNP